MIRAEQMSMYMGAKLNPKSGYENDVLIYVKPSELDGIKAGSYIDVVDHIRLARTLFHYPQFNIIVCSQLSYEYLQYKLFKNKLVLIPQQHCNFDNILRTRKEIKNVGFIGSIETLNYPHDKFKQQMADIGLNFINNQRFKNREEIVEFYKQLDIQVCWNPGSDIFKNPLRLTNAASFGIPTVGYPERGYKEFSGNYIEVKTIEGLIEEVKKLKDESYYKKWSDKIIEAVKPYHISKIAEKYKELCV